MADYSKVVENTCCFLNVEEKISRNLCLYLLLYYTALNERSEQILVGESNSVERVTALDST